MNLLNDLSADGAMLIGPYSERACQSTCAVRVIFEGVKVWASPRAPKVMQLSVESA